MARQYYYCLARNRGYLTTWPRRRAQGDWRTTSVAIASWRPSWRRSGTVTRRYTRCGTAGCKCHDDPPQPHGPYYQWTAKVDGKTVTRRLTAQEATLYKEWIANDRQMRKLIQQMRQVATKAGELKIKEVAGT